MTRSYVIISIVIALCLSLHFYLQWDVKRFKASLPKVPVVTDTTTEATGDTENAMEHPEKFAAPNSEGFWHGDDWHVTPHSLEVANDDPLNDGPRGGVIQEEHSQLGIIPLEEAKPIEDPEIAGLHTELLELQERQRTIEAESDKLAAAIEAKSISIPEVMAKVKDLNIRLQHLSQQQHLWRSKYVEYYGTEYPGTEHWVEHQGIDKELLREQISEDLKSRGYHLVPSGTSP